MSISQYLPAKRFWLYGAGVLLLFVAIFGCCFLLLLQRAIPPGTRYTNIDTYFHGQWLSDDLYASQASVALAFTKEVHIGQINAWYMNAQWPFCDQEIPRDCFYSGDHSIRLGKLLLEPFVYIVLEPLIQSQKDSTKITVNLTLRSWWHK